MFSKPQNESEKTYVLCKYPINRRPYICQAKTPYHNVPFKINAIRQSPGTTIQAAYPENPTSAGVENTCSYCQSCKGHYYLKP